jgi:hypothetical protein
MAASGVDRSNLSRHEAAIGAIIGAVLGAAICMLYVAPLLYAPGSGAFGSRARFAIVTHGQKRLLEVVDPSLGKGGPGFLAVSVDSTGVLVVHRRLPSPYFASPVLNDYSLTDVTYVLANRQIPTRVRFQSGNGSMEAELPVRAAATPDPRLGNP